MSQTLRIPNFSRELNILAQTNFTADAPVGVTSLSVINCAAFSNGAAVIIGSLGSNTAELNAVGTLASDTTLPLATATTLPHAAGETISLLFGTELKVYSAPDIGNTGIAPPDSTFTTLLATISIDPTLAYTTYTDNNGNGNTWYKFIYYNSTSAAATSIVDATAVRGDNGLNYCSLDEIRAKAGFSTNNNIQDSLIDEKRQSAQNDINGALLPVYVFPLPQPTNPIIAELTRDLAAAYLTQDVYRTTNPAIANKGEADELKALDKLNDLVTKRLVLLNAQFVDQAIPGGNGVSGYPDNTARGFATHRNGGGGQIFVPGMRY